MTSDTSTAGHLSSFTNGLSILYHHPLGIGMGTAGPRAVKYFTDPTLVESSLLLMGLELGVIGAVAYLTLIYKLLRWLRSAYRAAVAAGSDAAWVILAASAALAGSLISQAVLPVVQDATVMFIMWSVVACGIAAAFSLPETSESLGNHPQRLEGSHLRGQ